MILELGRRRRGVGSLNGELNLFGEDSIYGGNGFNFSGQPTSWWENLIETGSEIALRRYGQPPAGTMITTPGGTIVRTNPDSNPAVGARVDVGIGGGGVNSVVLIGGIALLAVLVIGATKR